MPKIFKKNIIIRPSQLKVIFRVIKFCSIADISKLSKIKSQKLSSLDLIVCQIQQANRPIRSNFLKSREFMIFFTYHCQSRILQRRGKYTNLSQSWIKVTVKSKSLRQFVIMRFMLTSRKANYQDSTIQSLGRAIQRRKTRENQH